MYPERKWWGALPQFTNSHKIWNWLGENCLGKGLKLLRHFGSTVSWRFIMAVFTLEDKQIVWMDKSSCIVHLMRLCVVLSSICLSRWANRLGKIVLPDRQIRRFVCWKICSSRFHIRRTMMICLSENDLSVQTICSSSSVKTVNVMNRRDLLAPHLKGSISATRQVRSTCSCPKQCLVIEATYF